MVQLRARKSLMLLALAALIVVALATVIAPRLVSVDRQTDYMLERETLSHKVEAPVPLRVMLPKLSVNSVSVAHASGLSSRPSVVTPLIARTATIGMLAGNVDQAIEQVGRLARANNGVVFDLETQNDNDPNSSASADISIRIPASRFDETLAALTPLGAVTSRSVKAEDLTADITDSGARLTNLRRTESDIRAIMDRSGSVDQIMDAENRLSEVREQIETLESDLKSMNGRVAYSSIDIHLVAEARNRPTEPTPLVQLGNAFAGATHALVQMTVGLMAKLIWLLVFAPYAAIVAAAAWLIRLGLRKNTVSG